MSPPKDKIKFPLWLYPETRDCVRELYRADGCRSQSEFIEKAIRFYVGYLTAGDNASFLPNAFLSTMKSIVAESDNRQNRMLFKLAVEMAMMMNLIADNIYGELFEMAAKRGIGLEINGSVEEPECYRMFGIAKECGCKFTLGTDAHSRAALGNLHLTQPLLDRLGMTESDLMDFVRV